MDPTRYNRLVRRLEELARTSPDVLRRRALWFVALGYGYVFSILIGLLATMIAMVVMIFTGHFNAATAKILFVVAVLSWLIVKSLWVSVVPPSGESIPATAIPKLSKRLEEIRSALDAPAPDVVLFTSDFNASVTQIPRFGIFGWPMTYLQLGVPLMCGMSSRQLDAVLAHEFAHLSRSHPKTGLWVFRVSKTWQQLLTHLYESGSRSGWLFRRFFRWYVPRLEAHGFAMSRRDEFEADAEAAHVAGADAMGSALVALEVRESAIAGEIWPRVWRDAETHPAPPERAWTLLPEMLRATPITEPAIQKVMMRRGLGSDTHPSVSERLRALGMAKDGGVLDPRVIAALRDPIDVSAADHYLGEQAAQFLLRRDRDWRAEISTQWTKHHMELRRHRTTSTELLAKDAAGNLDDAGAWQLARALDALDGDPLPYLRRAASAMPNNAEARFLLGRRLLAAGDPEGVPHIRAVMSLEPEAVGTCAALLQQFHTDRGPHAR